MSEQKFVPTFEPTEVKEVADVSADVNAQSTTETVVETVKEVTPAPAGSKTEETLLLKSLKEEREKRRELEQKIQTLQTTSTTTLEPEVQSDEGKLLLQKIQELEAERALERVYNDNPELKDKDQEFRDFAASKPGYEIADAAKLFMANLGIVKQRKGLEPATGSSRGEQNLGEFTPADTEKLRTTQPKKYLKMLNEGKFDKVKY